MSAAPEPGWYPDPAGVTDLFRWWDGQDWTDAISESTQAPAPRPRLTADLESSDALRSTPSWRGVVALALGIALFLSASAGIGLLIRDDPSDDAARVPVGGAGAGTRPTGLGTAPAGQLDKSSRTATIGPASLVLPDTPYVLYPDPMPLAGVLDLVFWSGATVHPRYDGQHDWSAAVLFGQLSSSLAPADLETQGRMTMDRLARTFFEQHAIEVKDVSWSDHSVDQNPGLLMSATMGYSVPSLPSRFDRVTAILVRLDDGSVVIAAASVPNDADPEVARQAAESLKTLAIR